MNGLKFRPYQSEDKNMSITERNKGWGSLCSSNACSKYTRTSVVQIDTSQHSQGFFERYGFQVKAITENYFAVGLHRVDMQLN